MDDVSDGIGVCFSDAFIFSNSVGTPVDVEEQHGKTNCIFIRDLVLPGFVFLWPCDIAVVDEFRLVSLLKIALEELLLGLQREILVIPAPVVEVVIVKADSPQQ